MLISGPVPLVSLILLLIDLCIWVAYLDPLEAPDEPTEFTIHFDKVVPVQVDTGGQEVTGSLTIFKALDKIGHDNGNSDF